MVRIWPVLLALRWSIMAASVVDLPEPVEPTTRTRPRCSITMSLSTGGSLSWSMLGISDLMARMTMPTSPRCLNTLTRKRPVSFTAMAMLYSRSRSNAGTWPSSISE